MKKQIICVILLLIIAASLSLYGCGKKETAETACGESTSAFGQNIFEGTVSALLSDFANAGFQFRYEYTKREDNKTCIKLTDKNNETNFLHITVYSTASTRAKNETKYTPDAKRACSLYYGKLIAVSCVELEGCGEDFAQCAFTVCGEQIPEGGCKAFCAGLKAAGN